MADSGKPSFGSGGLGYTQLIAWQKSYQLALSIYKVSRNFPAEERFGLTQQLRRAAVSISCNIAEGWGRGTTADYIRFAQIARGSLNEVQTQCWLARDLGYLNADDPIHAAIIEVQRLVNGLIRSLIDKTGRN